MATNPSGMTTRRRKRNQPPVFGGVSSSYCDKDNDFVCPICFDIIDEAHITKCGHTFCCKCIKQSLSITNRCPKCNCVITIEDLIPNFMLNELILKHKSKMSEKHAKLCDQNGLSCSVGDLIGDRDLDLTSVNTLLDFLTQKKSQLENDVHNVQYQVLTDFLQQVRRTKQQQLEEIQKDLRLIDRDLANTEKLSQESNKQHCDNKIDEEFSLLNGDVSPTPSTSMYTPNIISKVPDAFNSSNVTNKPWLHTTMASRRKRVTQHFDDLQHYYFNQRRNHDITDGSSETGLTDFMDCLSKFTRFNSFRPLATLSYASDIYSGSSIVSSIEFDRDCDYFAIAGVTKKIKVFEYESIIRDVVDIHYPVNEMICNSKISSLTWSSYHKALMASSDYEGTVTLWDAFTGVKSKVFQEHEKRCWSVDFNKMDPKLLASGSDDAKVNIWSTNSDHSISTLEAKANVCCVKFSPSRCYHLAFGSADHCVHYYDLRSTKQPLMVFRGHKKAVSYVKFINSQELVSASTDSQLKSWDLSQSTAIRTFTGHINDKNFVGLASDGDYVSCGSENNSLYIYYKGLSKHLLSYKFDTVRSVLEKDKKEEDTTEFVSAVTWKPGSNVVVAANSQGTVKILELV